ncbi:hypothetical protein SDC9_140506 [bioreactor metagenome]|uniref:Uncharacterized protein n=1 Tax=bioreactor metagenome TaxID=1076179 RepID=A0A645DVP7_9ZZZZ
MRADPDQRKARNHIVFRPCRSKRVGQASGGAGSGDHPQSAFKEAGVVGQAEGVQGLNPGVSPPLRLLAPRAVHIGIGHASLLGGAAKLPDGIQHGIRGEELSGNFQRIKF